MATEKKTIELLKEAEKDDKGPGGVAADISNVFGFATNSGKTVWERLSDDQADQLIQLYQKMREK